MLDALIYGIDISMSSSSGSNSSTEHAPRPPSGVAKPAFVRRSRRSSSKLPVPLKMVSDSTFSDVSVIANTSHIQNEPFLPASIPGSRRHSSVHESRGAVRAPLKVPLGRFHPLPAIPKQNSPCNNDSVDCMIETFQKQNLRGNSSPRVSADSGRWSSAFNSSASFGESTSNGQTRCSLCSPGTQTRSRSVDDRKHFKRMARFLRCVEPRREVPHASISMDTEEDIIGFGDILGNGESNDNEEQKDATKESGNINLRKLIRSNTYDVIPVKAEKEGIGGERSQSVTNTNSEPSTEGFSATMLPKRPSTTVLVPSGDTGTVLLALRLPSGDRIFGHFNEMDYLSTVLRFAERSASTSFANYILMANGAPIKLYRNLNLTLSELGLTGRNLLYVVSANANT